MCVGNTLPHSPTLTHTVSASVNALGQLRFYGHIAVYYDCFVFAFAYFGFFSLFSFSFLLLFFSVFILLFLLRDEMQTIFQFHLAAQLMLPTMG